ncbi:hypothetical protein Tco_1560152, partial [Tanacetum coccineum]
MDRIACTDAKSGSAKHIQLIRLMQFLMGDVYQPIRSTILAKDPLPNNYGLIGHIMDRCYELIGYPTGFKRNPNLSRQSENNNKRFNGNSEVNHYVLSTSGSLSSSFTNDQMMKLLNLINEKPSHTDMFNIVDMLTVGHPNGTLAKITAIGSLRLTSGIVLFDVFVVSGYNVSLLSLNRMTKISI